MLNHQSSRVVINIIVALGFILFFSACAKQPAKTALLDSQTDIKQEAVIAEKAVVEEKSIPEVKQTPEKPLVEASPLVLKEASVERKEEPAVQRKTEHKKQYIVRKYDSLWWIAKYKDIYNDPYLWPLIFNANGEIIKNKNRIYPGQKLEIPRAGFTVDDIKKNRKKAGAQKPYIPPQNANLPLN
jgi:nucleoid-associated protein YgaU